MKAPFNKKGGYTMGIGGVASVNTMSATEMTMARSTDSKSKNIKNEITGVEQQMKNLSSKEELSADEKKNEDRKLRQEILSLNTELRQHQEELRRSRRREILMEQMQKEKIKKEDEKSEDKAETEDISTDKQESLGKPADSRQPEDADKLKEEENAEKETKKADGNMDTDETSDAGLSEKKMKAIVSADSSVKQAGRQGIVIVRIRDGIVILKGEIKQDTARGTDTEKKQEELEKLEKREQRAMENQFSILGEANRSVKSAAHTGLNEKNNSADISVENKDYLVNAVNYSKEASHEAQQRFFISIGK